ncbi:MAG: prepilin-type N-terminal cleavage/methylation domain-containing protein [Planctomycetota bacterium]
MTTSATGAVNRRRRASPPGRNRGVGFTLVEVLLVLALLVVVAAIAAPRLMGSLAASRLDAAASELRTAWAKARLDAAAAGETLKFQCRIQTGWGCVGKAADATLAVEDNDGSSTRPVTPSEENAGAADGGAIEWQGVVYRTLVAASQPGDPPVGEAVADGELSAAVLFRPDGTTSDAEAVLEDAQGRRLRVTLRGLTGAARIEDVEEPADG